MRKLRVLGGSPELHIQDEQVAAQEQKRKDEEKFGVAYATRREHERIGDSMGPMRAVVSLIYDAGGGVVLDCLRRECTYGSGMAGKFVQYFTRTKSAREVEVRTRGATYTETELLCSAAADGMGDIDSLTFGLTRAIPLPERCLEKNGQGLTTRRPPAKKPATTPARP